MTEDLPISLAHLALDALPEGAAVVDPDRIILTANRQWRERRETAAALHPRVGEHYPGEDGSTTADLAADVESVLAGERESFVRSIDDAGVVVRVQGFDRGDQRHAVVTSTVEQSTTDWPGGGGQLLDVLADSIQIYDADAGQVYYNETAARRLGLDEQVISASSSAIRRVRERLSEDSLKAYDAAVEAILEGEADERRFEIELETAEAGPSVADLRMTPLGGEESVERTRGVVSVARDVTNYRRELRELEQRGHARETLFRVTLIVQDLIGGLVEETRRPDIEAAVVDHFDRSELYPFAFVGRHHPAREDLLEYTSSGMDETDAAAVGRTLLTEHGDLVRTGEVRILSLDGFDLPGVDGDAVAVPLTYGSAVYGLLCIGLGRSQPTARELSAFEVLGDVVGFAINAARHRRLATADLVTELEFELDSGGALLASLSAELDCSLTVDSAVPLDGDTQVQYLSVDGASGEELSAAVEDVDGVEDLTLFDADRGSARAALTVSDGSALVALAEHGATVRDAHAEEGQARVTAAIAADENAREMVAALQAAFPAVELVGKRDVEDRSSTVPAAAAGATERLTDRQMAVLESAYRAGYYETPRESTAEEVAESMGIASSTLHQHLQAAHRKLLTGVFEDDSDGPIRPDRIDPEP